MNRFIKKIVVLLLQCCILSVFFIPDPYLGIADFWYFLLPVCILGLYTILRSGWHSNSTTRYITFLIIYQVFPSLVALINYGEVGTAYLFSYLLFFIVLITTLQCKFEAKDLFKLINAYILSGAVTGAIILFQLKDYYEGVGFRFTIQIGDNPMFDPNYLGAFMVFPFIMCLSRLIYKYSTIYLIFFIFICIGILMTSSRGAMLTSSIGAMFCLLSVLYKRTNIVVLFKYTILIILFAIIVVNYLPEEIYARLFENSYADPSNAARFEDWGAGLKAVKESPIIGYGLQSEMIIIKSVTGKFLVAHNTFIGLAMQYGFLGLFAFSFGIIKIITTFYRKKEFVLLGSVVSLLLYSLFVSAEVSVIFWMPIIYIVTLSDYLFKNRMSFANFIKVQ